MLYSGIPSNFFTGIREVYLSMVTRIKEVVVKGQKGSEKNYRKDLKFVTLTVKHTCKRDR